MSAENEFEKIIFSFMVEAGTAGANAGIEQAKGMGVDYGHNFHFEDVDALRYFEQNAIQLSESSASRLRGNLQEVIKAGIREGKPIAEVKKDVAGIFENFKGFEAERIARTEIARGANTGAIVGYREMGIKMAEVVANAGACSICQMRTGELVPTDKAMQVLPRHPNCYCFWIPRPDMTTAVKGWTGLGEVSADVVKGLGMDLIWRRVSMAKGHARSAGTRNHMDPEELRIVVENAEAGFIDPDDGAICLLMEMEDGWGFVPVKQTEDVGLLAKSGYILTEKQKNKKLEKAETTYGL